jgi:hypothetical protein
MIILDFRWTTLVWNKENDCFGTYTPNFLVYFLHHVVNRTANQITGRHMIQVGELIIIYFMVVRLTQYFLKSRGHQFYWINLLN